MKLVRINFSINEDKEACYCFDVSYDEALTEQANCDAVLQDLIKTVEHNKPIVALKQVEAAVMPVVLNTSNLASVVIHNVVVYEPKKQTEGSAEENVS